MPGPGEYLPDATEGIVDPVDLPKPKIQQRSRMPQKCPCPECQRPATRHDFRECTLHHLGDPGSRASGRCPVAVFHSLLLQVQQVFSSRYNGHRRPASRLHQPE